MLEISKGKKVRPVRLVIYGAEGVGKSTFASNADDAVFVDLENGTDQMDVARLPKVETWTGLLEMVGEVAKNPTICKTLIIDTADKAEILCMAHICEKFKKTGIEDFGYGKGYTYLSEEYNKLLFALDGVIAAGINVIVTAHAKMRKFEQPDEMGAYDRWEMKLTKNVAPLLKEWCDALLFVNYKTYVVESENKTNKAQGGKRVMYATHHPCWDAKNRHGLPDEMDLDFNLVKGIFAGSKPAAPKSTYKDQVLQLIEIAGVTNGQVQEVVASQGYYGADVPLETYPEDFMKRFVLANWSKIVETINKNNGGKTNE